MFPFPLIWSATMKLLPERMDSVPAKAMIHAIGLQESRFEYRRQINGPARGFWQFEPGDKAAIAGVLGHHATRDAIRKVLSALRYNDSWSVSYEAIEHNDILACAYARCLLWTLPGKLPTVHEPDKGWQQYLDAWRPGRPHSRTWRTYFDQAWET